MYENPFKYVTLFIGDLYNVKVDVHELVVDSQRLGAL